MFIDTHAHINSVEYDDLSKVIEQSKKNNVLKVINASDSLVSSYEIIELSKKYKDFLYSTVGIHPNNVDSFSCNVIKEFESMIKNNKIVAIGEIGLDYYYSRVNEKKQIIMFEHFLSLASKYKLPVIIHSRSATEDTIEILKKYNLKGIIHCFSGSAQIAREYVNMGYLLGIGGVLTFKNAKIREIIKEIDLNHIVLETDSPFLAPVPLRGTKNEPSNIPLIAKEVSIIKNIPISEVERVTTKNALSVFDI